VIENTLEASVLTVKAVAYVTVTPLTTTVNWAELVPAKNPLVIHVIEVPDKATSSQYDPSEKVTWHALPSVKL
jgi:hypothetical protein